MAVKNKDGCPAFFVTSPFFFTQKNTLPETLRRCCDTLCVAPQATEREAHVCLRVDVTDRAHLARQFDLDVFFLSQLHHGGKKGPTKSVSEMKAVGSSFFKKMRWVWGWQKMWGVLEL